MVPQELIAVERILRTDFPYDARVSTAVLMFSELERQPRSVQVSQLAYALTHCGLLERDLPLRGTWYSFDDPGLTVAVVSEAQTKRITNRLKQLVLSQKTADELALDIHELVFTQNEPEDRMIALFLALQALTPYVPFPFDPHDYLAEGNEVADWMEANGPLLGQFERLMDRALVARIEPEKMPWLLEHFLSKGAGRIERVGLEATMAKFMYATGHHDRATAEQSER